MGAAGQQEVTDLGPVVVAAAGPPSYERTLTVDMTHLHTAEDVAEERLKLIALRERLPVRAVPGSDAWRARVGACMVESAITFRAIELGLETYD